MKPSSLRPIILRLEAMIEDTTDDVQVRRFETDGELRAIVEYNRERDLFILNDPVIDENMEFDNIDFVAMEVLELVQPVLPENEEQ
ncbi:MAG TPA: DUF1797 family protein [Atopostipes sp.]|nr:DUF1797 family protein [Atopostipes sp.]